MPVTFCILALLCAAIAVFMAKMDRAYHEAGVFALAAAMFAAFNLFPGLPTVLLFAATVTGAIVVFGPKLKRDHNTKTSPAERSDRRPVVVAAGLLVALVAIISVLVVKNDQPAAVNAMDQAMPVNFDGTTRKVQLQDGSFVLAGFPNGTGQGTADESWRQDLRANPESNFVIEGLLTQDQVAKLSEKDQLVAAREALIFHAQRNVFLLTTSAKNAGLWTKDVNDVSSLLTPADAAGNQFLSDEGRKLHADFADWMRTADLRFENAPSNSINTGFSEGGVSQSSGVSGNTKALVAEHKGNKNRTKGTVMALIRCGNPVFEGDVAPPGHTDEAPPRKPCECKEGTGNGTPSTTPGTSTSKTTTPGTSTSTTTTTPGTSTSKTTTTTPGTSTSTTTTTPGTSTSTTTTTPSVTTTTETIPPKPTETTRYPHDTDAPDATVTGPAAPPTVPSQPAGTTLPEVTAPSATPTEAPTLPTGTVEPTQGGVPSAPAQGGHDPDAPAPAAAAPMQDQQAPAPQPEPAPASAPVVITGTVPVEAAAPPATADSAPAAEPAPAPTSAAPAAPVAPSEPTEEQAPHEETSSPTAEVELQSSQWSTTSPLVSWSMAFIVIAMLIGGFATRRR